MNDLEREKDKGLSLWYLKDAPLKRKFAGKKDRVPEFGHAARLFAIMAKHVIDRLGPEAGEELIQAAVEEFAFRRGQDIARKVQDQGQPLSLKNWIIHSDIDPQNFKLEIDFPEGDLQARVGRCTWHQAAEQWGLTDYAKLYCRYADYKILEGYNPDVDLTLEDRHQPGRDHCLFRYRMKEKSSGQP
ncbi:MAG: L-2-amino-thiazoline-4-carboxylic acid hydrolase [Proteobacteria bacterium]|nr:L-2-amino-thiazoline-4-carboxylic acid hydrolase [Pseudomonadota bacterium]MBU1743094.1 L-2-amino-thiazoline-4-carboxylic acid hydrolase [Pseudomonadota bacterium]